MSRHTLSFTVLALLAGPGLLASPARAQAPEDHSHAHESLGRVHFPTTCQAEVQPAFDRAVALLHSFGYEEARHAFTDVARRDPACGMAHWGVAMTYYHPIWAPPTPAEFEAGRAASEAARRAGAKSARESRYIDAVSAFFVESAPRPHGARAAAFRAALETLTSEFPQDDEARAFLALSLLGTAPPSDTTYANQKRAAELVKPLVEKTPDHPGVLHYTIHAFDAPELATLALPAARAYAKVAPSSPHALHMPSHIFTRLGLWDECVQSNIASAAAGRAVAAKSHPGAASFDALHAMDYLEYAYLQTGNDGKAREVLDEVGAASSFDEPNFAAGYSLVAVPARNALERRDWAAAARLELPSAPLPWDRFPYVRGVTHFANALGAVHTGDLARARKAAADLEALHALLAGAPPAGPYDWAGQVESMQLAANGWIAYAEGRKDEAVSLLTRAAEKEEHVGKHPVTPGAVLPARELLGDLLVELGRPADALTAYERSLRDAPNRLNTLAGAAHAAKLAGDSARARRYAEQAVALCGSGCARPAVQRVKAQLGSE
jgi:tetratricopeptide (TPR) repeat protein